MKLAQQCRQSLTRSRAQTSHLETGQQAVAGGSESEVNDVSRLLADETDSFGHHGIDDRPVTDVAAHDFDRRLRERNFEAEIAHAGGDNGRRVETATCCEGLGPQIKDRVAITNLSGLIGENGAIGIAIEG
ncbi:MAG: hypothetical protein P8Y44_05160, partial [Acidobacteriota bacterium]